VEHLLVATLNIRNIADRWGERLPLLLADMAALQPDVIGLQEVVYPLGQDRLLGAAGAGHYETARAWAGRPEYGNALLAKRPLALEAVERTDLGVTRSALTARIVLPGGARLGVVVVHLHHVPADAAVRAEQARALVELADASPAHDALIVMGDFNAPPTEPAYATMIGAGFASAYAQANGAEPAVTWPSGIQAPGMDDDGEPGCLDYIWVRGAVRAETARLCFDRAAAGDSTLYPSDHLGVAATLAVG